MKNTFLTLAGSIVFALSGQVFAQTCASPLPISSENGPHDVVSGNTCTAGNPLPSMGGTPSPQNDIVYSFIAQGANATINWAQGPEATWNGPAAVFLLPACTTSTDPVNFAFTGTDMVVNGLTDGATYYLVATADGSTAADSCGSFTVSVTGTLPVSLQNFSVE